jgi:membrane protein DedA with SNARE-associated domain
MKQGLVHRPGRRRPHCGGAHLCGGAPVAPRTGRHREGSDRDHDQGDPLRRREHPQGLGMDQVRPRISGYKRRMAEADLGQLNGLTGWVASVIESLGELGVGLLVALENLVPPIPSEIVLALAGFLAGEGKASLLLVFLAATAGSVVGAVALYWLGYSLGEERLRRWLDRIPLVDADDLEKADRWFERHERSAVLFGRCAPVVRSLISIPAGANRMPIPQFLLFTAIGSGVWNALFIGAGYLLGERWQQVDRYSHWFDYAIGAFFVVAVGGWVIKKVRKRRRAAASPAAARPDR